MKKNSEIFEIHITGDASIHRACKEIYGDDIINTITVDLLKPNGSLLRSEHMTSQVLRCKDFYECMKDVGNIVKELDLAGTDIKRAKIECPAKSEYWKYFGLVHYIEAHYNPDILKCSSLSPISQKVGKDTKLATDRTYDRNRFIDFINIYTNTKIKLDLELCLFDSNVNEDKDWFDEYLRQESSWLCGTSD